MKAFANGSHIQRRRRLGALLIGLLLVCMVGLSLGWGSSLAVAEPLALTPERLPLQPTPADDLSQGQEDQSNQETEGADPVAQAATAGEEAQDPAATENANGADDGEAQPVTLPEDSDAEIAEDAGVTGEDVTAVTTGDDSTSPISSDNLVNPQQMPDSSFIYDTTITDLEGAETYLDDQVVQVVGEAIGDRINAEMESGFCWIALQEQGTGSAVISVFMTRDNASVIDTYGRYGQVGTILQVRGIFHLSCPQHVGLTDLHAENVSVISRGVLVKQGFELNRFIPGIVLVVLGLISTLVFRWMREGQR